MANLGGTFDANAKENNPSRCVPEGIYTICLVSSEEREAKKGGSYLNMEFEIVDGPCAGRKFFDMLGLWLASEKAVEIARGTLSAICRACGKPTVEDTDELCGIPFQAKVKVESDSYGEKNRLGGIVEKKESKPAAPKPAPVGAGQQRRHQPIEDDEIPF